MILEVDLDTVGEDLVQEVGGQFCFRVLGQGFYLCYVGHETLILIEGVQVWILVTII